MATGPCPGTADTTRVLFVDDEQQILSGLRRLLHRTQDAWDLRFALGGEAALAKLAECPADVVVTDMTMPGIDGVKLLEIVRAQYPDTVRIILSGHVDDALALRLSVLAHQYLAKPCEPSVLVDALQRVCRLRSELSDTSLRSAIGALETLPSPPASVVALTELLARQEASAQDVLEIIGPDPAMTAKLLQLVNSSFFGLPRRISDAREAIVFLGLRMIRDLLAAAEVFHSFSPDGTTGRLVYDALRAQATRVAEVCSFLGDERAQASVAGLLHDVGMLVLSVCRPGELHAALSVAQREHRPLHQIEADLMGTHHGAVGAYLLSLWGFPYETVEAVAHHHDATALAQHARLAHLVHVAVALDGEDDARAGREPFELPIALEAEYLDRVGLAGPVARWRARSREVSFAR